MDAETQLMERTAEATPSRFADVCELVKARLTTLVLLTTLVGFCLGSRDGVDGARLLWTLLGTALLAGGAAALNQFLERDLDALMHRTRNRPLPAGRIPPATAAQGGVWASMAGVAVLALTVNLLSAGLGAATLLVYLFVYTPMKRRTPLNTWVGALPGALPPVIGWAAARGEIGPAGWALFGFQFFWQMPHFLAIAWLYREDYARAGLRMLPVLDPTGERTAHHAVSHALALMMVSLAPVALAAGRAGLRPRCPGQRDGVLLVGAAFSPLPRQRPRPPAVSRLGDLPPGRPWPDGLGQTALSPCSGPVRSGDPKSDGPRGESKQVPRRSLFLWNKLAWFGGGVGGSGILPSIGGPAEFAAGWLRRGGRRRRRPSGSRLRNACPSRGPGW